jgi:deoxyribose-phosphate aldolase
MAMMVQDSPVTTVQLAQAIDHTKLTFSVGEAETEAVIRVCQEARQYGFYAVCVRPRHVALAKSQLQGSSVQVATVIGFPLAKVMLADELKSPTVGDAPLSDKLVEVRQTLADDVDELDLVMNIAAFKHDQRTSGDATRAAFLAIAEAAAGKPIKVILETDLLTPEEIKKATALCAETGMAMVKTSTGMVDGGHGGTLDVVSLIADTLKALGAPLGIKASGGIKTRAQAEALLQLGVSRIGTSSGIAIVEDDTQKADNAY